MTIPTLTVTNPLDMQTDVPVNQVISATFNTNIDSDSVGVGTVILFVSDTTEIIPVSLSVTNNVITALPKKELQEERTYTCVLVGLDPSGILPSIQSEDTGASLVSTEKFTFRTGFDQYAKLEEVTSRSDFERIGPILVSDLPDDPTDFFIVSSTPKNFSTNIDRSSQIDIMFNSGITSTPENFVTVEQVPTLGIDGYLGSPDASGCCPRLKVEIADDCGVATNPNFNFDYPTPTISASGSLLSISFDKDLLYNEEVSVTIDSSFPSADNSTTLGIDTLFAFTSEYHPLMTSSQIISMELFGVLKNISKDMLNRIILKNSIEYWELSGRSFDLCKFSGFARQYVKCKTVMDVIDILTLTNQLNQGTTKTLGDFTISQTSMSKTGGPKRAEALLCVETEKDRLRLINCGPKVGVLGIRGLSQTNFGMRLWSVGSSSWSGPIGNDASERNAKEFYFSGYYDNSYQWNWRVEGTTAVEPE